MSDLYSWGVHKAVLDTFKFDPNNYETCRVGVSAICALVANRINLPFFDDGIDEELIAAMRKFKGGRQFDIPFTEHACYLITVFCKNDETRRLRMGELGACELIHTSLLDAECVSVDHLNAIHSLLYTSLNIGPNKTYVCLPNHQKFIALGTSLILADIADLNTSEEIRRLARKLSQCVENSSSSTSSQALTMVNNHNTIIGTGSSTSSSSSSSNSSSSSSTAHNCGGDGDDEDGDGARRGQKRSIEPNV